MLVLGIAGLVLLLGRLNPEWSSPVGLFFSVFAASLAVFGIARLMARNIDLVRAQTKNAELAVENERTRFARDLHDILGVRSRASRSRPSSPTGCSTSTSSGPGPSSRTSSASRATRWQTCDGRWRATAS